MKKKKTTKKKAPRKKKVSRKKERKGKKKPRVKKDSISKRLSNINKKLSSKKSRRSAKKSKKIIKKEKVSKKKPDTVKIKKAPKGEIVEKYFLNIDKAKILIKIIKSKEGITYNLYVPNIGVATASLLNDVRNELISVTNISMAEMMDPSLIGNIKKRFMKQATSLLKDKLPNINPQMLEFLVGKLMQDMLGLGEIEFLVNDINLEEIVIHSSKESIRVYHKKYGWIKTNLRILKEEEIINYSNIVARRVGRQITVLTPLLDAHLVSGDRVNSILFPISTKGNTITIRKFARDPYTIVDLIKNNTLNIDIATLLWLAIEYEMNVLISGGTASGKTVILNSCMPFIPPNNRIISVEDTRELMLPEFLYWTPLVTRTPNPEGKGEVSMLNLLVNSLRMRPDRIVLGEMRRKEEAMVLFEAMHTGHSVYATVHADSATETINRLTNPPLNVPRNLLKAVNLNVVMFRDRKRGVRKVSQVAEFESSEDRAEANIIYRWIPEGDIFAKHSETSRFFEDISRNTGMSQGELNRDLEVKRNILNWMIKKNIRSLKDFGKVMNFYYTDKEELLKKIRKNDVKGVIGE
jgi:flagellar protein FlaI